jgi:spore maturation protein CgeB
LMLVKRDPWNAIEFFYEPEKEFLYYEDESELPDMIREITNNWEKYKFIVDNAYERAINNYTTEAVLDTMMRNEEVKR